MQESPDRIGVFKWSEHVIRQTIRIPDISDHTTDIFVRFSDHHLKTRPFDNHIWTIWIPNLSHIQMVTVLLKFLHTILLWARYRVLWHWRFRHWRLWHWRPRHWRFFGDIGGFLQKRHWRPGDIGGLLTLEAQPSRGAGKNIPKKGNICWCEAFVIPVARETHVARLNRLRPRR